MLEKQTNFYDCNSCLFRILTCQYTTEEELEIIRKSSIQLHFRKGETIFKQGTKSTHLVFLHRGIVKFIHENESEKPFITAIVKGTKLLGAANMFFQETNIFSLVAVEDCDICMIDHKLLRQIAVKHGDLILAMSERTIEMFQSSIMNFISLANKQVNGRIADILIYLWEYVYKNGEYEFNLSRKEIAEFAACSYENTIITLSRFNKEGIISLEGRNIVIKDLEKLYSISKRG
jgi:CRP/FNR family transcriptional regulator